LCPSCVWEYNRNHPKRHQFIQKLNLSRGLQEFGKRGEQAAMTEMKQLHERMVFEPINIENFTWLERKRALESLIFLTEKRNGDVKGRNFANGSTQREYVGRDEAASPTAVTESIIITSVIDAKEGRDIMRVDFPNAFVQTGDSKNKEERIIMKIQGTLVDMLLELNYEKYLPFVLNEGWNKVLYVVMLKALYGMVQSASWFYTKFKKDIEHTVLC
jgi:hypothetical protein